VSRTNLHIDWTRCDGRGLCTELLPNLLVRDDWGYPLAADPMLRDKSNIPLDPTDRLTAADAVTLCPRLALSIISSEPKSADDWDPHSKA
jgi:ferredoxin